MKRKKGPPHRQISPSLEEIEEAHKNIRSSLEILSAALPNSDAAQHLLHFLCEALNALYRYLEHPQEAGDGLPGEPPWHPIIASKLADKAIKVADVTLAYVRNRPKEFSEILSRRLEWPAIISLDPTRDIRKVARNRRGSAAQFYAPILMGLGRDTLFPASSVREESIFHRIATAAAENIRWLPGWPEAFRRRGLPWWLDYVDPTQIYALRSNHHRTGNNREWAIALKYLLHLTLAPDPFRSQLRAAWRAARVDAFRSFTPRNHLETRQYDELVARTPQPSPTFSDGPDPEEFSLPDLVRTAGINEDLISKKLWVSWWENTLKYEPDAFFGHLKPLHTWSDPAVVRLTSAAPVKNSPRAAFGRCVDAILNAFLHLRGVAGGLNAITETRNPLPLIRPNRMAFGDELRRQATDVLSSLQSVDE